FQRRNQTQRLQRCLTMVAHFTARFLCKLNSPRHLLNLTIFHILLDEAQQLVGNLIYMVVYYWLFIYRHEYHKRLPYISYSKWRLAALPCASARLTLTTFLTCRRRLKMRSI